MIARLRFVSAFVYSAHGVCGRSRASRRLRDLVKCADEALIGRLAERVAGLTVAGAFPQVFGADVTLVAVPGHAPAAGAPGVSQRIAMAFAAQGLAGRVAPMLERVRAVAKAAFCTPPDRPSAQEHFDTLVLRRDASPSRRIVLVDDFITRGATLIGAASRLQSAQPGLDLCAFALVRSVTDAEVTVFCDPRVGVIKLRTDGSCRRRP